MFDISGVIPSIPSILILGITKLGLMKKEIAFDSLGQLYMREEKEMQYQRVILEDKVVDLFSSGTITIIMMQDKENKVILMIFRDLKLLELIMECMALVFV